MGFKGKSWGAKLPAVDRNVVEVMLTGSVRSIAILAIALIAALAIAFLGGVAIAVVVYFFDHGRLGIATMSVAWAFMTATFVAFIVYFTRRLSRR